MFRPRVTHGMKCIPGISLSPTEDQPAQALAQQDSIGRVWRLYFAVPWASLCQQRDYGARSPSICVTVRHRACQRHQVAEAYMKKLTDHGWISNI